MEGFIAENVSSNYKKSENF